MESSNVNKIKSKTANELSVLQGAGSSKKNLMERFAENKRVERVKTATANELAALQVQGGSLQSRVDELNHSLQSNHVDKIKSQTAAEPAVVQAEQLKKKKEAEESTTRSVDDITADEEPHQRARISGMCH
jgi:TolA-binding protein